MLTKSDFSFHKLIRRALVGLIVSGVHLTGLSENLTYMNSALERWVGNQPVRAIYFDEFQGAYIATQAGLIKIEGSADLLRGGFPGANTYLISDEIVGFHRADTAGVIAYNSKGDEYLIKFSPQVFSPLKPGLPQVHAHPGQRGGTTSHSSPDLSSSSLPVNSRAVATLSQANHTEFETFAKNFALVDSIGACSAAENLVTCVNDLGRKHVLFRSEDGINIKAIEYLRNSKQLLAILTDDRGALIPVDGVGRIAFIELDQLKRSVIRATLQVRNEILFATDSGLFSLNTDSNVLAKLQTGGHSQFTYLSRGSYGIWAASETGVAFVAESGTYSWPESSRDKTAEVYSFAGNGSDGFFVGSEKGILYQSSDLSAPEGIWPRSKNTNTTVEKRASSMTLIGDELFVGTFNEGLLKFQVTNEGEQPRLKLLGQSIESDGITALFPLKSELLVGTYSSGLLVLSENGIKRLGLTTTWHLEPAPVTSITATYEPNVTLVTTEDEILLICDEEGVEVCAAHSLQSDAGFLRPRILSSAVTRSGTVWLGTLNHGLIRTSIDSLLEKRPIPTRALFDTEATSVYSLILNDSEDLWLGTNVGLFLAKTDQETIERYGTLHGLTNTDFHHGSFLRWENGKVALGGAYGFDLFDEESLRPVREKPILRMRSVRAGIGGAAVWNGRKQVFRLELPNDNRGFVSEMDMGDFRSPKSSKFQYQLQGYDKDWISIGSTNVASYTSLPPGEYVFRARGANAKGVWSTNEISLPVIVHQSPWRTWPAYFAYLTLLALGLAYLKKLNDRRVLREHRAVLAEEASAAFSRLEDDYQEQQELSDYMVAARAPSATALLDMVRVSLSTLVTSDLDEETRCTLLDMNLELLKRLQALARRTAASELLTLSAAANEIWSILNTRFAISNFIFVNDASESDIELSEANYLCLVMLEGLVFAVRNRPHPEGIDPIIELRCEPQLNQNESENTFHITVRDSGEPDLDDAKIQTNFPITLQLLESFDGSLSQEFDRGNQVNITLRIPSAA